MSTKQAPGGTYLTIGDLKAAYPDFSIADTKGGPPYMGHMLSYDKYVHTGHLRVSGTLDGLAAEMDDQRLVMAQRLAGEHPGCKIYVLEGGEYRATDADGGELARGTVTNLRAQLPYAGL